MTSSNLTENQITLYSNDRILRWPEVHQRVGISRSHVHNLVSHGKFPPPIKLGERASGWVEREIDDWLQKRIKISRAVQEVV